MGVQRPGHVDSDCPGVLRVRERTEEQEGDGIWGSVGVRRTSIAGGRADGGCHTRRARRTPRTGPLIAARERQRVCVQYG